MAILEQEGVLLLNKGFQWAYFSVKGEEIVRKMPGTLPLNLSIRSRKKILRNLLQACHDASYLNDLLRTDFLGMKIRNEISLRASFHLNLPLKQNQFWSISNSEPVFSKGS